VKTIKLNTIANHNKINLKPKILKYMEHGGKDCLLLAPNVISLTRIQFPTSTINVSKHLPKASGSICMSVICSPNNYNIHDITDEILIGTINTNNSPSMQGNHNRCDLI
jgi:hypothetical protein